MGVNHDDKSLGTRDLSSPKKQQLMKLGINLERQVKIQTRDYYSLELTIK